MRIAAFLVVTLLTAHTAAAQPSVESTAPPSATTPSSAEQPPSTEQVFGAFDLFGDWAANCKEPASPANPHVAVTMPTPGLVQEDHDLGNDFAVNHYSVLQAARLSAERVSIDVIFGPGTENEQRQKLILQIRKATRRTLFNQPEGGEVRVKNGIALARGTRTPLLKKCG
jgi:hypothetical protein